MTWVELRKELKLTQQNMAEELGISRPLYQMKEKGKRKFTFEEATIILALANKKGLKVKATDMI